MKKHVILFGKTIPTILLVAIAIIGVAVSVTSIVYYVTKPAEISILPHTNATSYEIELYEDQACTEELTRFNFPTAKGGDVARVFFYIKNLSTGNITVDATFVGDIPEGATGFGFMDEHYSKGYVDVGEVAKAEVYIALPYDVKASNYEFDITINVYPY